jgi:lysophospholipase L1-like esterase
MTTKMSKRNSLSENELRNSIIIIITLTSFLILTLESISSIAYYQINHSANESVSSTASAIVYLSKKVGLNYFKTTEPSKFDRIRELREIGENVYPSYLFEPQMHSPDTPHHLANVSKQKIIDCNESGFFNEWTSDEYGFRNPNYQVQSGFELLLIGDSFTEGACENDNETIAGVLRQKGYKVANLGRGGSGPLFQLGSLVEYGSTYSASKIIWIIFTGNDLLNLREEKIGILRGYLDPSFSQNLVEKKDSHDVELRAYLDEEYRRNLKRSRDGIGYPRTRAYGETLDVIEALEKERHLLLAVAQRMLIESKKVNATLNIVVINHYAYSHELQDITSLTMQQFASSEGIPLLEFSRDYLIENKNFFTSKGPHFNREGYQRVGEAISDWTANSEDGLVRY